MLPLLIVAVCPSTVNFDRSPSACPRQVPAAAWTRPSSIHCVPDDFVSPAAGSLHCPRFPPLPPVPSAAARGPKARREAQLPSHCPGFFRCHARIARILLLRDDPGASPVSSAATHALQGQRRAGHAAKNRAEERPFLSPASTMLRIPNRFGNVLPSCRQLRRKGSAA